MYNRYQGNSGRVVRVKEQTKPPEIPKQLPKQPPKPTPKAAAPPLRQLGNPLKAILPKGNLELETEDIILLLILYLMYRKSGDSDLLIMMGAMFLL